MQIDLHMNILNLDSILSIALTNALNYHNWIINTCSTQNIHAKIILHYNKRKGWWWMTKYEKTLQELNNWKIKLCY